MGRAGEERARAAQRGAEADGLQQELAGLLRRREQLRRRLVPVPCPQGVVFLQGHQHPLHPKLHVGASVGGSGGAGTQNRLRDEGEQHLGGRLAQGRARLQRYHEEAGGELLRGRDEVVQLRARLEAVRHDVLQGESCWTQIQSAATHKTLLLGQIRMAVLSLFQLATKHLKVPRDVALEDTETQLDVVSAAPPSPGQRGWEGHPSPLAAVASGPPSPQVLLCMQDLAAICAELRPKEPGLGPPRVPATTTTRPRHHRGVTVPPSHQ
uniref:Uncharacterized protein n=1 Tax=Anser cygnoides TaxID=8845 RepID=A0A8B9INY0_ANSCY